MSARAAIPCALTFSKMKALLLLILFFVTTTTFGEGHAVELHEKLKLSLLYDSLSDSFIPNFNPYEPFGGADGVDQTRQFEVAESYTLGYSDGVKAFSFYSSIKGDGRLYMWLYMQIIAQGEFDSLNQMGIDDPAHVVNFLAPNMKDTTDSKAYGIGYASGLNVAMQVGKEEQN